MVFQKKNSASGWKNKRGREAEDQEILPGAACRKEIFPSAK